MVLHSYPDSGVGFTYLDLRCSALETGTGGTHGSWYIRCVSVAVRLELSSGSDAAVTGMTARHRPESRPSMECPGVLVETVDSLS